jgi:hypothetical protein
MEQLINLLIQKAYHHYKENYYQEIKQKLLSLKQEKLAQVFLASFHNAFVSFVGWEFNYNRFGSTLSRQLTYLDEIIIYQHDIKLNRHFLFSLMGYSLPAETLLAYQFTFSKLLETIAEEVAHCLVREFYPNVEEHGVEFKEIEKNVLVYLKQEKITKLVKKELERNGIT